ncbi:hypothetical protein VNO80_18384 [Phaseolus coccineus]|uniref:Uncharacterized protein n=1 Tax=Phaseolus coccineus TaxID=3886 RepID=A0AAN9QYW4_PHACN
MCPSIGNVNCKCRASILERGLVLHYPCLSWSRTRDYETELWGYFTSTLKAAHWPVKAVKLGIKGRGDLFLKQRHE